MIIALIFFKNIYITYPMFHINLFIDILSLVVLYLLIIQLLINYNFFSSNIGVRDGNRGTFIICVIVYVIGYDYFIFLYYHRFFNLIIFLWFFFFFHILRCPGSGTRVKRYNTYCQDNFQASFNALLLPCSCWPADNIVRPLHFWQGNGTGIRLNQARTRPKKNGFYVSKTFPTIFLTAQSSTYTSELESWTHDGFSSGLWLFLCLLKYDMLKSP